MPSNSAGSRCRSAIGGSVDQVPVKAVETAKSTQAYKGAVGNYRVICRHSVWQQQARREALPPLEGAAPGLPSRNGLEVERPYVWVG